MSQGDQSIANQAGAAFRADLNAELQALVSQSSGATAPATTYAYQWWADTTTGLLKRRNAANSAWITLGLLDGTSLVSSYFQATGIVSAVGTMSFEGNFLVLQGGTAGFQVRDSGDANTNFQITDGGLITSRGTITKRKAADQSVTSSIVLANDSDLTFAIAANEEWIGNLEIVVGNTLTVTGAKVSINGPAGTTSEWDAVGIGYALAAPSSGRNTSLGTAVDFIPANWASSNGKVKLAFWILNGATSGSVTFQFAQSTSSATPVIARKGSFMQAVRVA